MSRRLTGSVVGALVLVGAIAPAAQAAAAGKPAKVSVRVEAPDRTVADAIVTTTAAPVVKDGKPADSCTGTSAAGALQLATKGRWTASWFNGLGYAADTIGGVKPSGADYWTFWLNGKASTVGLCAAELQPGDQVLEFICHDATAPDYACKNRPLALIAPKGRVRAGRTVTVKVVTLKDDGTQAPAPGAIVRGGVKPATAGADGTAKLLVAPGQSVLRATRAGDVPAATVTCAVGPKGGTCGSSDRTPPALTVKGIKPGQRFTSKNAPRAISGSAVDPNGAAVELRLTRVVGTRCTTFDAASGSFRRCGRKLAPMFSAGDRAAWSYLLPSRLGAGRYVLDVRATDQAGNASTLRLRFTVGSGR